MSVPQLYIIFAQVTIIITILLVGIRIPIIYLLVYAIYIYYVMLYVRKIHLLLQVRSGRGCVGRYIKGRCRSFLLYFLQICRFSYEYTIIIVCVWRLYWRINKKRRYCSSPYICVAHVVVTGARRQRKTFHCCSQQSPTTVCQLSGPMFTGSHYSVAYQYFGIRGIYHSLYLVWTSASNLDGIP